MSKPAIIKLEDQYKNDTYDGVQFTLLNTEDSLPIDITGATLRAKFRYLSKTGDVVKDISNGSGITVSDAVNGIFSIDSFVIDWVPSTYYYDIELTFSNGTIRTYIGGTIKVIQDVTYG